MLADRLIEGEDTVRHRFLGEDAAFPTGPFRMAAMLRRPIVLMFGLYRGGNRYDVFFERLPDGGVEESVARLCAAARALLPRGAVQLVQLL